MFDEKPRGPFCNVAGCTRAAVGAFMLRDPKEWYRYLCAEHVQPVHAALNGVLTKAHRVALAADVRG
jgi:hypothetical protein